MSRNPRVRAAARMPPPVAADMSARATARVRARACACATTLAALTLALLHAHSALADDSLCTRDGLIADYDTECQEYVRCIKGTMSGRYSCPEGRVFNEAAGACVPKRRHPCIRRVCAAGDNHAYTTPGTTCRHYYRCENGTAIDHFCPFGTWFDIERQACTRGAGTCYEPLCTGLPNGAYPDSSQECRRMVECISGEISSVISCANGPCVKPSSCPSARSSTIPLPAGDADFCSDEACSSWCQQAADGAYADRSTACREYFVCKSRRAIRRGVCESGFIFSDGNCVPAAQAQCPPPVRSPCFNRANGLHRDWRNCSSWFECRRERVISKGSCERGLVFDGTACVTASVFSCEGPQYSLQCESLPTGTYQDLKSNCTKYFHCEGSLETVLSCPFEEVYNGVRCVPSREYLCPSLERDSCYGRADGRYRAADTGCRGYYACINGEKAVYACPTGMAFNGGMCVPDAPGVCPTEDDSCTSLTDGYHAELETGCHRYFYCEGGDRLATLSCLGGKIFDGQACVAPSSHECGAPKQLSYETGDSTCQRDGFFYEPGTDCKRYYFCITGIKTSLSCPLNQVFNGQVCVPKSRFTCPG